MTATRPGKPDRDGEAAKKEQAKPEWASGLRQLYDSVVDEPLPDAFKDLLSKLDAKD
ncbi:hypothetical protein K3172_14345 [Qipengyuania sp. 6B39]|uniref:NepR family anti-sigma factor n=1 Tax=Qipengyuania proteolytica TaxID=2867239 RepID=UPI001C891878|nr:NepR family anti-sigma factor [Qipengyuania proteolytica]MBX7497037.1 hypothetical protein [Qipengyuania proteolytica]